MRDLPHEKQIAEYEKAISRFREQNQQEPLLSKEELTHLEETFDQLKARVYATLTPWQRVQICRHPQRPQTSDFVRHICSEFIELAGDRLFKNDPAVIGGLAKIEGHKFMLIGQEKGNSTETRLHRNFGMLHPEGFRKALRLAQLAEKFALPIIFLLDTPGAYAGLAAEERGQGWAIAYNLRELFRLATPMIVIVIGEGCSGGALGMGIGDRVAMLEHSYYSVISPEGCAAILWEGEEGKNQEAAAKLKMQAEDLLQFGVIDEIIKEPPGGAHYDPQAVYLAVKRFILKQRERLASYCSDTLLEERYQKFRKIGFFDEASFEGDPSSA